MPTCFLAAMLVLGTVGIVLFAGAVHPDKAVWVLAIPLGLAVVLGTWQAPVAATLILVALISFDSLAALPGVMRQISLVKILFPIPLVVLLLGMVIGRFKAPRPHPLDKWIAGWTALYLLLCLFAEDKTAAFDFFRRWVSLALLYLLITRLFTDKDKYRQLLVVMVFSMAVSCLIGLSASVAGSNPFSAHQDLKLVRITGATGMSPNNYAASLMLPLVLAAAGAITHGKVVHRRVYLGVVLILVAGITFTYSRSAFMVLVTMAAIAAVAWHRHITRAQWAVVAAGLLIVVLLQSEEILERVASLKQLFSDEEMENSLWRRQNYLRVGLNIFKAHPFLGAGPGNFAVLHAHPAYQPHTVLVGIERLPHNTYLQVITETGLVGLIFFIGTGASALGRTVPALRTRAVFPQGLFIALIGFAMMGLFLHLLLEKYVWITLALVRSLPEEGQWFAAKSSA